MSNKPLDKIFRKESQPIKIIMTTKEIVDDIRNESRKSPINPISIQAIVTDLNATQANWKLSGLEISRAKQIVIKKKDLDILLNSYKIEINNEEYIGWKQHGQLQYRHSGKNYVRIYIYNNK